MNGYLKENCLMVGIGELLWDMFPHGKRLGGAPANFAIHASSLGGRGHIVSSIGNDLAGREIMEWLGLRQLSTRYVQIGDLPTGRVDVKVGIGGHPEYVIQGNVAWDTIELSSELKELAQSADAVCFGTLAQRHEVSRFSIQNFVSSTTADCLRVFDLNLRQCCYSQEIITSSLRLANVLKLNDDELVILQDMFKLPDSEESSLRFLIEFFDLKLVALTKGALGSTMVDHDSMSRCPGMMVNVKDSVGAGDSFTTAMVMGKLGGLSLHKINYLAGKIAAYVCSQAGATPSIPESLVFELEQQISLVKHEAATEFIAPKAN